MDATVKPIGIYLRRVSKVHATNTYATINISGKPTLNRVSCMVYSKTIMTGRAIIMIIFFLNMSLINMTTAAASTVSIHKNETTGLLTWTAKDTGFSIELIQLIPDFIDRKSVV